MAMRNILTPSWFPPSRLFPMLLLVMLVILAACGIAPPPPDKTVYVVSETGTVYAVRGTDGSMLWRYQVGDAFISNVVVLNNIAYVDEISGAIDAIHANNGSLLWQHRVQRQQLSAVAGVNASLYVSAAGFLYAFRASDGAQLWKVHVGDHGPYEPTV